MDLLGFGKSLGKTVPEGERQFKKLGYHGIIIIIIFFEKILFSVCNELFKEKHERSTFTLGGLTQLCWKQIAVGSNLEMDAGTRILSLS